LKRGSESVMGDDTTNWKQFLIVKLNMQIESNPFNANYKPNVVEKESS